MKEINVMLSPLAKEVTLLALESKSTQFLQRCIRSITKHSW